MERHFVTDDGVLITYDEFGLPGARTVVLCHGLAAAANQFTADGEFFASKGFRVLVPNLRGHGASGLPARMVPASFTIPRLSSDLIAMLDHAGASKVHWVGNSLGGIVALQMLPRKRFTTLTTFGTAYRLSLPRLGGHLMVPLAYRTLGASRIAHLTSNGVTGDIAARKLINDTLLTANPKVTELLTNVLTRYDLIANAQATDILILLLRGGRDFTVNRALPTTLRAMQSHANFTLRHLPTGGHCANLDATDDLRTEVLRFWEATE